jgi:hypothetical protein
MPPLVGITAFQRVVNEGQMEELKLTLHVIPFILFDVVQLALCSVLNPFRKKFIIRAWIKYFVASAVNWAFCFWCILFRGLRRLGTFRVDALPK